MKTLFVSLLFTLVTTTSMGQIMKPEYDWNKFDEESYQLHKKELNQYYDSKKEEVIKIEGSRLDSFDLEQVEWERKLDLDMLEYSYKIENKSFFEKMIGSIKLFLNTSPYRYLFLGLLIGGLYFYWVRVIARTSSNMLIDKFKKMGDMSGVSKTDIINQCGRPTSVRYIQGGSECVWSSTHYTIVIHFDKSENFIGVVQEVTT